MRWLARLWCRRVHGARNAMWPVHGSYECRRCHQRFEVRWTWSNVSLAKLDRRKRVRQNR